MLPKRKLRDKNVEVARTEEEDGKEKDITEKLKEVSVGPIRMSDRKSGDINMFGDKIQTCSVTLNKLNPDITRTVLDRQKTKEVEESVSEPEQGPSTLSVIKGEDCEKNIRNIVESSEFEEFDITTQLDILDTSKKKIEEIKRKSQEQISQLREVDKKKVPETKIEDKIKTGIR